MSKKEERVKIELFGDTSKIIFDPDREEFQSIGLIGPAAVSRLLNKIAEYYKSARSKRGKRISEIASELATLIDKDYGFFAETYSFISAGKNILLSTDHAANSIED